MRDEEREELLELLTVRTLPDFDRRKKRLESLGLEGVAEALNRARFGLPLTREQFILSHGGFLPEECVEARRRLAEAKARRG